MHELNTDTWTADWMWSLPLIVVTVLLHTFALALMDSRATRVLSNIGKCRMPRLVSMLVMGATVLSVTVAHGTEGVIWAAAFRLLGALPETKSAMLYSLNAITTYGHTNLYLAPHWELMGALEALNGLILFGLTTAYLVSVIQKVWPHLR